MLAAKVKFLVALGAIGAASGQNYQMREDRLVAEAMERVRNEYPEVNVKVKVKDDDDRDDLLGSPPNFRFGSGVPANLRFGLRKGSYDDQRIIRRIRSAKEEKKDPVVKKEKKTLTNYDKCKWGCDYYKFFLPTTKRSVRKKRYSYNKCRNPERIHFGFMGTYPSGRCLDNDPPKPTTTTTTTTTTPTPRKKVCWYETSMSSIFPGKVKKCKWEDVKEGNKEAREGKMMEAVMATPMPTKKGCWDRVYCM